MEASHKKHRPHIKVGKDAEEEEDPKPVFKISPDSFLHSESWLKRPCEGRLSIYHHKDVLLIKVQ